jgi:hypothetical protein
MKLPSGPRAHVGGVTVRLIPGGRCAYGHFLKSSDSTREASAKRERAESARGYAGLQPGPVHPRAVFSAGDDPAEEVDASDHDASPRELTSSDFRGHGASGWVPQSGASFD